MKPIHYARKKRQLKVLTKDLQYHLVHHRETTSKYIDDLVSKIKTLLSDLIHVLSGADLKKILGSAAVFLGISFTNSTSAQTFDPPVFNAFGLSSTYYLAAPNFVDLDADGDQDLLVGEYYGNIRYFENTGSAINPQFAEPQLNPFGLDTTYLVAFPTSADLDGDGDFDILVGGGPDMYYFENTGSPENPQFAEPLTNAFGLTPAYLMTIPALTDLDGDGDFDLLVGQYYGSMAYYENTGTTTEPQFELPEVNPFSLTSTLYLATIAFADLDEDGDMDLLVGEYYGAMRYFENIGSANNPLFDSPQYNPFGLISTYGIAFPSFTDLDGDSDLDLLVGDVTGAMYYFENNSFGSVGITERPATFELSLFPNPLRDVMNIETSEEIKAIEIFDISGKTVLEIENPANRISLIDLRAGAYMARFTTSDGKVLSKHIQVL